MTFTFQKACKFGFQILWVLILSACGSEPSPVAQTIVFDNSPVSFTNSSCTAEFTLVNSANLLYTLSFLQATFTDVNDDTYSVEIGQNELIDVLNPIVISGGGVSQGEVIFDLESANLTPPLTGNIVIVGIASPEVTHFVGEFECN